MNLTLPCCFMHHESILHEIRTLLSGGNVERTCRGYLSLDE